MRVVRMWASGTGTPFRRFNHHLRYGLSGLTIVIGQQRAGSVVVGKGAMVGCGSGRRLYSTSVTGSSRRIYIRGKSSYFAVRCETDDSSDILWTSLMMPIKSWYVFLFYLISLLTQLMNYKDWGLLRHDSTYCGEEIV
jgi:hypothetical protein